ncbi:hypothetical protein NQ315_016739 [Exocentrus adspersus]|uniref:Uncharacterized protein n=1 Tax=Exocentrus adspersus TaxID=1586481 RepID=A0AAV8VDH9_9CUCU|nr:hypothetical protein NQ315_016739 [Exocentrus adspersus]
MSKAQNQCSKIGKYLLVQMEWVTSDGNIGTLGTSFGLNWIFLFIHLSITFTFHFYSYSHFCRPTLGAINCNVLF